MEYQNINAYGERTPHLWSTLDLDESGDTGKCEIENIPFPQLVEIAKQGDGFAMLDVSYVYFKGGDGVEKDLEKSFYWMHRAAEAGNDEARYFLELFYRFGGGIHLSMTNARYRFTQAAKNCYSKAWKRLSELRERGE